MRFKFETIANCEGGHYRGGGYTDRQQERQVCEGGGWEAVHLLHGQQDPLGGKGAEQEVNLCPDHPGSTAIS